MVAELTALRDQIDEVDKALLELLARRMSLVAEVGEVKSQYGLPIYVRNARPRCWRPVVRKQKPRGVTGFD